LKERQRYYRDMDYKDTLNLPKTDFPMKAKLPSKEPELLKRWEKEDIYRRIRERFADCPKYILHDGPPYANGHIHMGTALNKILKDIVVKIKTMEGYNAIYVPGWDCHGLPIEHNVDKELGPQKSKMSKLEIRGLCREYAEKFVKIQKDEFKRLGVFGDWDRPYLTMDFSYEAAIVRELGKFFENGSVYRGLKPVRWCPRCKTALAEAEVEYEDHESPSIYVRFPLESDISEKFPSLKGNIFVVIWTTTPWTLPANLAICLHPDFSYAAVKVNGEILIVAEELMSDFLNRCAFKEYTVIETFRGKELEGLKCRHPLMTDKRSELILGEHVTLEQGTGCVHTAPGHGEEDYEIGIKYGLDIYNPVDESGKFLPEVEHFAGMNVFKANNAINAKLKDDGYLIREESITHSYPNCWRCKNPIILRATSQWFISMEKNDLREKALRELRKVAWVPAWGEERIYGMIENRPDWCISRQRVWGVPITAFYCRSCGEVLSSKGITEHIADMVERHGSDIWFEKESGDILPPGTQCSKCNGTDFDKENDILDVWFDSGVSHAAVLEKNKDMAWPADMYLEGSDQHRGWFNSSLLISVGTREKAPYKTVLTHGYVVDGRGKKMSKSMGNVIAPQEIIDTYGAELLRLWVSSENYREDIRISKEILRHLTEAYKKIRNTLRFILGNLYDYNPEIDKLEYNDLFEIDRLILHRLQGLIGRIREAYNKHEYHLVFHNLNNFCAVDLSSFYLDILKDRLYIMGHGSKERQAAQTAIHEILMAIVRLMAPILSFTAEEIWGYLPEADTSEFSVHLSRFPSVNEDYIDKGLKERWDKIISVRGEVSKALEIARADKMIGHSLDARVDIYSPNSIGELLRDYRDQLSTIFIVSAAVLNDADINETSGKVFKSNQIEGLKILISRAAGKKCERCWIYSETVGDNSDHPTICKRCASVLKV